MLLLFILVSILCLALYLYYDIQNYKFCFLGSIINIAQVSFINMILTFWSFWWNGRHGRFRFYFN